MLANGAARKRPSASTSSPPPANGGAKVELVTQAPPAPDEKQLAKEGLITTRDWLGGNRFFRFLRPSTTDDDYIKRKEAAIKKRNKRKKEEAEKKKKMEREREKERKRLENQANVYATNAYAPYYGQFAGAQRL